MTQAIPHQFEAMPGLIGTELGVSDWITVDQAMIDGFAEVTRDRQWIHIDRERASAETPFGTTIAHGYLTLSLVAHLSQQMNTRPAGTGMSINYGLDRVRFLNPVKSGSRVRLRQTLEAFDPRENGQYLMRTRSTVEIEGEDRPALVADNLVLLIRKQAA